MATINLLDSSGKKLMDSVSPEYEDSFSIETFADLIEEHEKTDPKFSRHFIIARVRTWDSKKPGKEYYSYYSAFNLNKILFQTQSYLNKRLIHRIRVMNPLTNTDIVGSVEYFIVRRKPGVLSNAHIDDSFNPKWNLLVNEEPQYVNGQEQKDISPIKITSIGYNPKDIELQSHDSTNSLDTLLEEDKPLEEQPSKFKSFKKGIHDKVTKGTKALSIKVSSPTSVHSGKKNNSLVSPSLRAAERGENSWTFSERLTSDFEHRDDLVSSRSVPESELAILTSPTTGVARATYPLKIAIPQGQATRFAVPLSASVIELEGINSRKIPDRELSFKNMNAESPTLTLGEWKNFQRQRKAMSASSASPPALAKSARSADSAGSANSTHGLLNKTVHGRINNGVVHSPVSPSITSNTLSGRRNNLRAEDIGISSPKLVGSLEDRTTKDASVVAATAMFDDEDGRANDEDEDDEGVWEAILFATDSDYLERSSVRQIFRDNAIETGDCKHFEMKPFVGDGTQSLDENGQNIFVRYPQENAATNAANERSVIQRFIAWCYPSREEAQARHGSDLTMEFLSRAKCYIVPFVIVAALLVVIVVLAIMKAPTQETSHSA